MSINKETEEKINELKSFEQALSSLILQKQAFQIELDETENALKEIENSKDDIFKLVGNIMVKADKLEVEKELKHRKELILLRLRSIEKQESELEEKTEELKEEIMDRMK